MKIEFLKIGLYSAALAIAVMALPQAAHAAPMIITDSPQNIGGFTHNVFHTSVNGGGSGSILAWFDLDTSETNTYDPDTGSLMAHFNIFNDSAFNDGIGSVWASGSLPSANFQGDGGLAGSITWTFDFDVNNILQDYLNGQSAITMNYLDQVYTQTVFGTDVNSWDEPYLSLWGAGILDSQPCDQDVCEFDQNGRYMYLGSDVVLEAVHTPEPMSLVLMTAGLAGAFTTRRKKKS